MKHCGVSQVRGLRARSNSRRRSAYSPVHFVRGFLPRLSPPAFTTRPPTEAPIRPDPKFFALLSESEEAEGVYQRQRAHSDHYSQDCNHSSAEDHVDAEFWFALQPVTLFVAD